MRSVVVHFVLGVVFLPLLASTPSSGQGYGGPMHASPYMHASPHMHVSPPTHVRPPMHFSPAITITPPPTVYYPQPRLLVDIAVYDNCFTPNSINVPVGTTVRWINRGHHRHTITSRTGLFDSGDFVPGFFYTVTFPSPGVYPYYCRYHSHEMYGVIIVR
jgi:hypothetical protein